MDLSRNQLEGPIPEELGALGELKRLNLESNGLTGTIPSELDQLSLFNVFLSGNAFTGCIPANLARVFISDLSYLELIVCDVNQ